MLKKYRLPPRSDCLRCPRLQPFGFIKRRHRPHGLPYQCMRFGRSSRAHIGHSQFPQKRRGCHGGCFREGHSLVCPAIWRQHCFRVRDYGPPLTNEVFETLSHPTVSHKPHGLGLGLSLAKSIAERHRGHIDFVRAQPNGLIAVLELPCLLNTSPSEAGTTVLQDSGQRKTHHE